jgi:hypothetical protein
MNLHRLKPILLILLAVLVALLRAWWYYRPTIEHVHFD